MTFIYPWPVVIFILSEFNHNNNAFINKEYNRMTNSLGVGLSHFSAVIQDCFTCVRLSSELGEILECYGNVLFILANDWVLSNLPFLEYRSPCKPEVPTCKWP